MVGKRGEYSTPEKERHEWGADLKIKEGISYIFANIVPFVVYINSKAVERIPRPWAHSPSMTACGFYSDHVLSKPH